MFRRHGTGTLGESLVNGSEAACYYHSGKKAATVCDSCGRFLCQLCDVAFNRRHLCPICLETGKKKGRLKNLENHRTLYDSMALYLAVAPILLVWVTIITAPAAIFVAIRYWRAPGSIIPRTKVRRILALLIAGMQIGTWTTVLCKWIAS
jgi:hypothetical protein